MKIGLFFGSFDPVHYGHLQCIESICKNYDWVLVIPSYQNPTKNKYSTSFSDRFKMCQMMFEHLSNVSVSPIEYLIKSEYTYLVLDELYDIFIPDNELNIIVTDETMKEIPTWKNGKNIIETFAFEYIGTRRNDGLSSTIIRNNIKNNKSIKRLTNINVIDYIKNNNLYE